MQERAACKSCLGTTLEENGEAQCHATDYSIVCKIALNSMSAMDGKTKDAEHSFVTWWGSMCCGGAWGQEVHQTSHAALHHKTMVKVCNTSLLAGKLVCKRASIQMPTQGWAIRKKNIHTFPYEHDMANTSTTFRERGGEKYILTESKCLFTLIQERICQVC